MPARPKRLSWAQEQAIENPKEWDRYLQNPDDVRWWYDKGIEMARNRQARM